MARARVAAVMIAVAVAACSKQRAEIAAVDATPDTVAEEPESDAEHAYDELAETGPRPPVVPMPMVPGHGGIPHPVAKAAPGTKFDRKIARAALAAVPYKDCGTGGLGEISVTFAPEGHVAGALVSGGIYDAAVMACLMSRFRTPRVPPFDGDTVTIAWSIEL